MKCGKVRPWLNAFVDGELTGRLSRRIEEHLARCNACRRLYEDLKKLKGRLERMPRFHPSSDFKARLMQSIQEMRQPTQLEQFGSVIKWRSFFPLASAAAVILMASFVLFYVSTKPLKADILRASADCHQRCVDGKEHVQFFSEKPEQVGRWLSKRLAFPVALPGNLARPAETLVGCSTCTLINVPSGLVFYQQKNRKITLIIARIPAEIWQDSLRKASEERLGGKRIFRGKKGRCCVFLWRRGDVVYSAASDAASHDMIQFVTAFQEA